MGYPSTQARESHGRLVSIPEQGRVRVGRTYLLQGEDVKV